MINTRAGHSCCSLQISGRYKSMGFCPDAQVNPWFNEWKIWNTAAILKILCFLQPWRLQLFHRTMTLIRTYSFTYDSALFLDWVHLYIILLLLQLITQGSKKFLEFSYRYRNLKIKWFGQEGIDVDAMSCVSAQITDFNKRRQSFDLLFYLTSFTKLQIVLC